MPLNLAIIGSRGFPSTYGGYETLVRYLARYLVAEGHNVTVYCREREDKRRMWTTDGVRCIATRGLDSKTASTPTFGATSIADAALRGYDAALVLNIGNGFWLPALRARGIPFAVNTDGIEWDRDKWGTLGRTAFKIGARLTARVSPAIVCDSQAIGAHWLRIFGRTSHFIPYGGEILPPQGRARMDARGLTKEPYALVVARLAPENNVDLFLDAIEHLGALAPRAIVVGDANFDAPIKDRLASLDASSPVTWLGHVDDQRLLHELWSNAGVYVHGHSVGGTNPALLQALGAGAPTLALDTEYNREVLPHDAQLFTHDAGVLAAQIANVIESPATQGEMRERGQTIVRTTYQWDDVCRRYTELLVALTNTTSADASAIDPPAYSAAA